MTAATKPPGAGAAVRRAASTLRDLADRAFVRWAVFPAVVAIVFVVLVVLEISGSSIGMLSSQTPVEGLLAGEPRPVRSDEFLLTTPSNVSSVLQGFPSDPWIGLSPTDLEVAVHSGISLDWTTLFHPDDWGYLFLGSSRGLAFTWWWSFAVSLWAVYALIGMLTRRPLLAGLLAVVATFTPYSAWWSAAPPSLVMGYGVATGALLMAGFRARRVWSVALWAVGAGYVGAVFVLMLYPPWALSVAYVVAAAALGYFLDRRLRWRRAIWVIGVSGALIGGVMLAWYLQNRGAITALAETYYPGSRLTEAGTGSWRQLLSGPLNFWMAGEAGATLGRTEGSGPLDNLSEISSSWLPLPVVVLLGCGAVWMLWRRRDSSPRVADARAEVFDVDRSSPQPRWTMILLTASFLLILAWTVVPLPDWFGVLTQLNRVQPSRAPLALGLAVVLLVAVAAVAPRKPAWWSTPWVVAAASANGALTLWAAFSIAWDSSMVPMSRALASGVVLALLFGLVFTLRRGRAVPAALLAGYTFVSWFLVNPVQQGTAPLEADPITVEMRELTAGTDNPRTMVFADFTVVAKVRAAGLQTVSGQTPIPDREVMTELAPEYEGLWNSYVKYQWHVGEPGEDMSITQRVGTTLDLTVDPCAPELAEVLDAEWIVSDESLADRSCVTAVGTVPQGDGEMYIYRVGR
jgi:hypothetical protein